MKYGITVIVLWINQRVFWPLDSGFPVLTLDLLSLVNVWVGLHGTYTTFIQRFYTSPPLPHRRVYAHGAATKWLPIVHTSTRGKSPDPYAESAPAQCSFDSVLFSACGNEGSLTRYTWFVWMRCNSFRLVLAI